MNLCGRSPCAIFGARTLSLVSRGRVRPWHRRHAADRHVRACRLIESLSREGTDGGAPTTAETTHAEVWRRDVRPPSDWAKTKKPATDVRRGLSNVAMMSVCR